MTSAVLSDLLSNHHHPHSCSCQVLTAYESLLHSYMMADQASCMKQTLDEAAKRGVRQVMYLVYIEK